MFEFIQHRLGHRNVNPVDTAFDQEEIRNLIWGVVVTDMQPEYTSKIKSLARLVANQLTVLETCIKSDIPVALLETNGYEYTLPEIRQAALSAPRHGNFWHLGYSGFSNQRLDEYLRSNEIDALLFMGINACVCVLETADDAVKMGYRIAASYELMACACKGIPSPVAEWYMKNGIYQSSHRLLLDAIIG